MRAGLLAVGALIGACGPAEPDGPAPGSLGETGWFDDTDPVVGCGGGVLATEPAAGESAWPTRAPLRLFREGTGGDLAVRVLDGAGVEVPIDVVASADGLVVDLVPQRALEPSTPHTVSATTCAGALRVPFTTSSFGAPLADGPKALLGRTWALRLDDADWVEPGALGAFFRANVTVPVLMGASWADAAVLDLIGTQGAVDEGVVTQDLSLATWNLPTASFARAPWFDARGPSVELDIEGAKVPVTDFRLSATFSADAARVGDGVLSGLADTRQAGGLIDRPNAPTAICELAQGLGVPCIPCDDGLPLCVRIEIRDVRGVEVPGLRLVPVGG